MSFLCSKKVFFDYIVVLMILLLSKSSYFLFAPLPFLGLFLCVALVYHQINHEPFKMKRSVLFVVLLYCLYVFNGFFYNGFRATYFIMSIGTFLIVSSMSLISFREKFFNVVFVLALLSIITYAAMVLGLISPTITYTSGNGYLWHYYGFNFQSMTNWELKQRNSGIFHEPGAFQIVLNFALLFVLTAEDEMMKISHYRFKFMTIIIALVLTKSTNAYISTMVILFYAFRRKIHEKKHLAVPIILLAFGLFYYVMTSEVVVEKFAERDKETGSAYIRMNDNIACLKMFAEHPILGVGTGELFTQLSASYGNKTSSNGIVAELARLGVLWGVLYFGYFFSSVKRICERNMSLFVIFVLVSILLFSNEDMMGYPIAYIVLFPFADYNRNYEGDK